MNTNNTSSETTLTQCRYCNHPIKKEDKICKHCLTPQKADDFEKVSLKDPTLAYYDWIIMFFSQLLGMFLGLIHFLKGEKLRGKRLIIYSFILLICKISASFPIYYIFKTFHKLIEIN